MIRVLKIIGLILLLSIFLFSAVASPYCISYLPTKLDKKFEVSVNEGIKETLSLDEKTTVNLEEIETEWFNYYGVLYKSDSYVKGSLSYKIGLKKKTEEFFLEPTDEKGVIFYSFIDDCLEGVKATELISVTFEVLKGEGGFEFLGFNTFNRENPKQEVFIESDEYKLGVDLNWGGALSYLEDMNSNVQAVSVDGFIKVDSNATERYNAESVNDNVNLINRYDPGRLVQQSYYGTDKYDTGVFMENVWRYNPVQGGNQFGDASKIVDLRIDESSIYIKCRPLDWAKEKEFIAPSYMEATYKFEGKLVKATCRFVDFSGYPEAEADQELPAFYCIEPFNEFVYYGGDKPWTNGALTEEPELIFWPDAGYPKFKSLENWAAFKGEFDDSFGIGVYVPNQTEFLSGVFDREKTTNSEPDKDGPTSYIAVVEHRKFQSFTPSQYDFYLTTGDTGEIRNNFKTIEN